MSIPFHRHLNCVVIASSVLWSGLFPAERLLAADSDEAASQKSEKAENIGIEPYKGPPIYLEEGEKPPKPTIVSKQRATNEFPDGTLRWEREVAKLSDNRYVADGFYREFHPNGKPFVEGTYENGKQVGTWTYWHDNGTKNREVTYDDGLPSGQWETYRADGSLQSKHSFENGKRDGQWIIYDETGKEPRRIENYSKGVPDGEWKLWFPSGQINREVGFKNGKRDGPIAEWREDGSKVLEGTYVEGKLDGEVRLWSTDGREAVQHYKDGRLESRKVD